MPPADQTQDQNTNVNPQPSFGSDQPAAPVEPTTPPADDTSSQPDVGAVSTPVVEPAAPVEPTEPVVPAEPVAPVEPIAPEAPAGDGVVPPAPTEPASPEAGSDDGQNNQPFVSQ